VKVFRGGLIGCGYFSQHHQEAWKRMPNVQIVAACDRDIQRAQAAAVRAYSSAEEMLDVEDLDFVDIVTRSTAHMELIAMAAVRGLAIICQKPMAPDWETACRIVEVSENSRVRLMIHDNWRWQPWYRTAHSIIARGDIGSPVGYGFRCRWPDGSGDEPYAKQAYFRELRRLMIDETLVHHIDTARFLFGNITSIYAEAERINARILGEDHAILTLRHVNQVLGWMDGHSLLDHEGPGPTLDEATFEGDLGSIRITNSGEVWSGHRKIWSNDFTKGYRGDSVYATQAHFIDCLETGLPFETSAREYLEKTFAVVEAAYSSVAWHRAVGIAEILSPVKR
jgi:predicted dehydrogenase